MKCFTPSFPP